MLKKVCGIMAVIMALTVAMTGCNDKKPAGVDGQTLIRWAGISTQPVEKDSGVQKYLEEKFDVKLDIISITSNYDQKLGAMIASGDIPDVFFAGEPQFWQPLVDQGVLAEVSKADIEKFAPRHYEHVNNYDERIWFVSGYKDKNWAVPKTAGIEYNTSAIWRKDWLTKLGIEKIPETLDEFEEAFVKMRFSDPDGNGVQDTYGVSGFGGHTVRQFDNIFGAFGVMPGQWRVTDGRVVNGTVTDEARRALELLNKWYSMGIIDPEFITDDTSTLPKKFESGKLGVYFASVANYHPEMPVGKQALDIWSKIDPSAEFEFGSLPVGENGEQGDWLWGPRGNFVVFGKQLANDNEKMGKILSMLDEIAFSEEVAMRVVWGEQGVTFDYNDSDIGQKSGLKYLSPYDMDVNERAKAGVGLNGFFNLLQPSGGWAAREIVEKYQPEAYTEVCERLTNIKQRRDELLRLYLPSSASYSANLDRLKTSSYSKFITGELGLDKWDDFVSEWLSAGGKALTEEAQLFYDDNFN